MPRVKKRPAPKTSKPTPKTKTKVVPLVPPKPASPSEVMLERFMDIHWGLSGDKRSAILGRLVKMMLDKETDVATFAVLCQSLQEFDKINLGAMKLVQEAMVTAKKDDQDNGRDGQLTESEVRELVAALASPEPAEVVEAEEGDGDEIGPRLGEPFSFDESVA